jgi:hypothetical protein
MNLQTAELKDIIAYLLVTPRLTEHDTGEILLNLCQRLEGLEAQNKKQDAAIDGTQYSLGQLWQRRKRGQIHAVKRRAVLWEGGGACWF